MTIWERVYNALVTLGLPLAAVVYRAASGAALPATFLTYQLIDSTPELGLDDDEALRSHRVQVTAWCTGGFVSLPDVAAAMTAAGFTRGPTHELGLDGEHYGLAMEFLYLEDEL